MPEYLAPGVYVEETSFRSKSIEGVSTTTTGFVGPCRYGPVTEPADVITSLGEFELSYAGGSQLAFAEAGGQPDVTTEMDNYLWHAVRAFFTEGGKQALHRAGFPAARWQRLSSDAFDSEPTDLNAGRPASQLSMQMGTRVPLLAELSFGRVFLVRRATSSCASRPPPPRISSAQLRSRRLIRWTASARCLRAGPRLGERRGRRPDHPRDQPAD